MESFARFNVVLRHALLSMVSSSSPGIKEPCSRDLAVARFGR